MAHELSYDSDTQCIILRIQDKVTIELIRELAPQVASMVETTGCHRLLNDMSASTIDIPFADLFASPKIMTDSGVEPDTKRALVVPSTFDEADFLETISRNRGHNLMIFKDIEKAKAWLLDGQ